MSKQTYEVRVFCPGDAKPSVLIENLTMGKAREYVKDWLNAHTTAPYPFKKVPNLLRWENKFSAIYIEKFKPAPAKLLDSSWSRSTWPRDVMVAAQSSRGYVGQRWEGIARRLHEEFNAGLEGNDRIQFVIRSRMGEVELWVTFHPMRDVWGHVPSNFCEVDRTMLKKVAKAFDKYDRLLEPFFPSK